MLLIILVLLLFLLACTKKSNISFSDKPIKNGDLVLNLYSSDCSTLYGSTNYSLSARIKIINHNPKPYNFNIISAIVVRESNKAEYSAKYYSNEIVLECDMERTIDFSATLPTSIEIEQYYLEIREKQSTYRYYLYETPNDQRKDITISYKVDNSIVKTETIKEGRIFNFLSDYISDDKTKYVAVNSWSIDGEIIDDKTIVNNNIIVESKSKNIFSTSSLLSDKIIINDINYIPKDGIVVLPEKIYGKEISISSLGYSDDIKEIYFPLNFSIYISLYLTFLDNLTIIYYPGTSEEFSTITMGKLKINANVKVCYNTSYRW